MLKSLLTMWDDLVVKVKATGRSIDTEEHRFLAEMKNRIHNIEVHLGLVEAIAPAADPAPAPAADPAPAPAADPAPAPAADPAPAPAADPAPAPAADPAPAEPAADPAPAEPAPGEFLTKADAGEVAAAAERSRFIRDASANIPGHV